MKRFKKFLMVLTLLPLFLLYSNCAGNGSGGFPSEGSQNLPSTGDNTGAGGVATPTPAPNPSPGSTPRVTPTPSSSPTVTPTPTPTPMPTMTPTPTPSNPANPNGRWVLSGYGGRHMTSADGGKTWTNDVSDIANGGDDKYLQRAATYFKGTFITVGWRIQRSTDGMTFQSTDFMKNWYGGVAEGNGRVVAVGACGNRAYSNDGLNWMDLPDNTCSTHLRSVVYGGGKFFAYGDGGSRSTSADGVTWTKLSNYTVTGVAYGMGYFWGVNSATKVVRSTDGVTWTDVTVAGATGFGGFYFVNNSLILTTTTKNYRSLDGNTWAAFGSGMNGKIAYGGGVYIGITWQTVYRSTDGMTWSQVSKGGNSFEGMAWAP